MSTLIVIVWTVVCIVSLLIGDIADAASSASATFNDSRCAGSGVCLIDPLLFTCELNEVVLLRVILPNGHQEVTSTGDTAGDIYIALPGVTVEYFNITDAIDGFMKSFFLTLSIMNASLLDGGEIICDNTKRNVATARCKLHGPPSAPYDLLLSSNTLTTATITWKSTQTDVTYIVNSTSLTSPMPGIRQEYFILRNLEVETEYMVSVIAVSQLCGEESLPSEVITVRIDMSENLSIGIISAIVGGGVVIIVTAGGTCLLLTILLKKMRRTKPDDQKPSFTSHSGLTSQVVMAPSDIYNNSQVVNSELYDGSQAVMAQSDMYDNCQVVMAPSDMYDNSQAVMAPSDVYDDIDSIVPARPAMGETSHAESNDVDHTYDEVGTIIHAGQPSSASPMIEKTPASGTFPTYQKPSTIIHTPHPTTGVIYSDINVERKKRMKIQTAVEEGPIVDDQQDALWNGTQNDDSYKEGPIVDDQQNALWNGTQNDDSYEEGPIVDDQQDALWNEPQNDNNYEVVTL